MDAPRLDTLYKKPCPSCGAPSLDFDAGSQQLKCANCGYTQAVLVANDQVVEASFTEGLTAARAPRGLELATHAYACQTCGAVTQVELAEVVLVCPFCASQNVNERAFETQPIRPFGLVPFKVVERQAREAFKTWIGQGWFHPNDLKKFAEVKKLAGVYVPFWTYDADTHSAWTAEAGYYYYETHYVTNSQGQREAQQVQKIRWEYASGHYDHWFDDVTVVASQGISQSRVEGLYPFALKAAVNYDPQFLLGWQSEVYKLDMEQGYAVAEGIMDSYIEREIISRIPGDTHRNLRISTRKSAITFKHLLLPVWIAAYHYGSKTYQVLVNGETGKVTGEKPLSWIKITLTVLAVLLVIAAGVYIYYRNNPEAFN
jgi:Zn finger protein HypA/HybF involved in hydrogenase expression